MNDKPWTTPVVQAVAGDGQLTSQANWDRPPCFKTLQRYNPDKYRLEHGQSCGANHKPGDPVDLADLYFPLNLTHDPHARVALLAYSASVAQVNPALASSLRRLLGGLLPVDPGRARQAAVALSLHANQFEAARISTEGEG